jgi:hypothetical protein
MVRDCRIEIFMSVEELTKIKEAVEERGLVYGSNSDLFRKICFDYEHKIMEVIPIAALIKEQNEKLKQEAKELLKQIDNLRIELSENQKQIGILENNLALKVQRRKNAAKK